MEIEIYKNRSIVACLREATNVLTSYPKSLLKATWIPYLVVAVINAIVLYINIPNQELMEWGETNPWPSFIMQTVLYLSALVCGIWAFIVTFRCINHATTKQNIHRFAKFFLAILIYSFVIGFVTGFFKGGVWGFLSQTNPDMAALAAQVTGAIVLLILVFLFFPSILYTEMKFMLEEESKPSQIWTFCKAGMRHWGSFFSIVFLSAFIIIIPYTFLMAPILILTATQVVAQLGALNNQDPIALPNYFPYLYIAVGTATAFIGMYVDFWANVAYCYMFGSIETREREKKELNTNTQTPKQSSNEENTIY